MFDEPKYLAWAIQQQGTAAYDLASSGIAAMRLDDLGARPDLDDPKAWCALRAAIARHLATSEDTVIATLGTAHAVLLAYACVAQAGDEIVVEAPTYEPLLRAAEGIGARVTRFERRREDRYAVDPDAVLAAITSRTKLVIVSNLHNPTGVRTPDATLRGLAGRLAERKVWLVVDEVYAPFDDLVGEDGVWTKSARSLGDNVICTSSLTKCYGLGLHRFGWLSGPREIIARAEATLLSTCGMLPLCHAALGVMAFAALPRLADRTRGLLGTKRARVAEWIASRSDIAWSAPEEGLFGFVHLASGKGPCDAATLRATLQRGFEEHGVLVAPGEYFEMPDGFRLAWSLPDRELTPGLERLGRTLDLLAARRP